MDGMFGCHDSIELPQRAAFRWCPGLLIVRPLQMVQRNVARIITGKRRRKRLTDHIRSCQSWLFGIIVSSSKCCFLNTNRCTILSDQSTNGVRVCERTAHDSCPWPLSSFLTRRTETNSSAHKGGILWQFPPRWLQPQLISGIPCRCIYTMFYHVNYSRRI